MNRRIEIKLDLSIVLPLLDILRQQAAALETSAQTKVQIEPKQMQANMTQVRTLLALFRPNFSKTARITVGDKECPTVLRACSFLRLHLRYNALSAIPDATLESGLNPKLQSGEEHGAIMCYLFLATIQEVLLKNSVGPIPLGTSGVRPFEGLTSRIQRFFRRRGQAPEPSAASAESVTNDSWQVVVINDPVNLMAYVSAVFQSVLALPENAAQQRMREVHELKSSTVWAGPRDKAEAYVRALQAWHLQAALRQAEGR